MPPSINLASIYLNAREEQKRLFLYLLSRLNKLNRIFPMLSWTDIVQNYVAKYSNQIRKATLPLRDHFGINYFTYHQIDSLGKYTVLVDRPDWAERYVEEQIFLSDPYLRHPSVYESGICLLDSYGSQEYKAALSREGKAILNMDIGVMLIQKHRQSFEFFGFTANKKTSCLQNLYLNHPRLLTSFAVHFKRELWAILRKMTEEANTLLMLKGPDFFHNQPICPGLPADIRAAYLKDLGIKQDARIANTLTPRERDCLKLLLEMKSAKETAALLGLSRRTVYTKGKD